MKAIMMIGCMVAVLAAGITTAGAPALPHGTWAGTAKWRGAGDISGSYAVERTFDGRTMKSKFTWNEGQARTEEHVLTFSPAADPTFEVLDSKGQAIGTGYCVADACAYRANVGGVSVDESLRWSAAGMTVLGSKSGPNFSVVWSETLRVR